MKKLTARWVRNAEADVTGAGELAPAKPTLNAVVYFHCQQAAEKYLKSLLQGAWPCRAPDAQFGSIPCASCSARPDATVAAAGTGIAFPLCGGRENERETETITDIDGLEHRLESRKT